MTIEKLEMIPLLNDNEKKLVQIMLDQFFNYRCHLDAHESLGLNPDHEDNPSCDWLDDVASDLAEKVGMEVAS